MGLLDDLKKLTRPYDEEEEFFDDDDELEEDREPTVVAPRTERQERRNPFADTGSSAFEERAVPKKDNKVVNIHTTTAVQVVLAKPERFEQAAEIADHLRDKRTVVINLETTNKDVARRLVDFLSGVAYANDGKIKKVAINTYIITPYNVDIIGDLIDELENNGVYI
ncbi:MAG: cell division protein SepF [Oscillospiraceae bacterium]|nr:cell division protein SepF [Oscillospiraceae bacterium]